MADEDEEDYMSDRFLQGIAEKAPGLVPDKIAKNYKKELRHKELNERNKVKPLRVKESEHREHGLANALDSSNKGFAMLEKMGFKHGMGLGKDGKRVSQSMRLLISRVCILLSCFSVSLHTTWVNLDTCYSLACHWQVITFTDLT